MVSDVSSGVSYAGRSGFWGRRHRRTCGRVGLKNESAFHPFRTVLATGFWPGVQRPLSAVKPRTEIDPLRTYLFRSTIAHARFTMARLVYHFNTCRLAFAHRLGDGLHRTSISAVETSDGIRDF